MANVLIFLGLAIISAVFIFMAALANVKICPDCEKGELVNITSWDEQRDAYRCSNCGHLETRKKKKKRRWWGSKEGSYFKNN